MTEGVECERKDGVFVCFEQLGGWFGWVGVGERIVIDGTARVTSDEERMMDWVPLDAFESVNERLEVPKVELTVDFVGMTLHRVQLAESTNVKQLYLAIPSCSSHEVTVRTPLACVDGRLVRVSAYQRLLTRKRRRTYRVESSFPDLGSQNLTNMSLLPLTISPLVGCQSTHRTSHP